MTNAQSQIEANKKVVLNFFDDIANRSLAEAIGDLKPDCVWWSATTGNRTAAEYLLVAKEVDHLLTEPIVLKVSAVTAEDDRVAVESSLDAMRTTGVSYNNVYHFLFRVRDGEIVEVREHHNTAHAAQVWKEFEPQS